MQTNHKLDKSFGPVGSTAGIFLFVAGIAMFYWLWTGAILALMGAFVGFSHTSTSIDIENCKARCANCLFGIFPMGKWLNIKSDMQLHIKKSNIAWRTYSLSNRSFDMPKCDYRILLFTSSGKEIMPLQKFKNIEDAQKALSILRDKLNLVVH